MNKIRLLRKVLLVFALAFLLVISLPIAFGVAVVYIAGKLEKNSGNEREQNQGSSWHK